MPPALNAPAMDARIDHIARRQSAKFLDRLRQSGEATPAIERDFMRSVRFLCTDIKAALREPSQEAPSEPRAD